MIIHVTQEDIDNGVRQDCRCCPVALALKRVARIQRVFLGGVSLSPTKIIWFPPEVKRFIERFDWRNTVQPFSFELDIPDEYLLRPQATGSIEQSSGVYPLESSQEEIL
jgi:hypothetical protein